MNLDTPIVGSKLKIATWLGFFLGCMLLGFGIGLSWWQGALASFGFGLLALSTWFRPIPTHIACDGEVWEFLLMGSSDQQQLWSGCAKLTDFGFCVLISANLTHPQTTQRQWLIYADMPTKEQWHRLRALARF